MTSLKVARAAMVAAVSLAAAGCDVFDDLENRFKTCEDTNIVLTNDPQSQATVSIIGPEEVFGDQSVLESGHSRTIRLCIERGDRKRFRVGRAGEEIAAVNCVASLASYEAVKPAVVWAKNVIRCDNW